MRSNIWIYFVFPWKIIIKNDEKKVIVTISSPRIRNKVDIKIKFPEGYENGYWPKKDKKSNQLWNIPELTIKIA